MPAENLDWIHSYQEPKDPLFEKAHEKLKSLIETDNDLRSIISSLEQAQSESEMYDILNEWDPTAHNFEWDEPPTQEKMKTANGISITVDIDSAGKVYINGVYPGKDHYGGKL